MNRLSLFMRRSWTLVTDNGKPQRPLPWDSNSKPKQFERALRSVFA